jgi:hypothetical protein
MVFREEKVHKSIKFLRSSWTVARNGDVEKWGCWCRALPWRWFPPHLLLCCSMKDIPALKGEEITFLVSVSCMRRKRMEAFVKSWRRERRRANSDESSEN